MRCIEYIITLKIGTLNVEQGLKSRVAFKASTSGDAIE